MLFKSVGMKCLFVLILNPLYLEKYHFIGSNALACTLLKNHPNKRTSVLLSVFFTEGVKINQAVDGRLYRGLLCPYFTSFEH